MKVALVHEWLVTFAGSEQVLLALSEMYPDAPIFVPVYNPQRVPHFRGKKVITSFLQRFPSARSRPQIYLPLMLRAFESFDLNEFDLVISSSHALAKGAVAGLRALHICYCHFPLRYVWEPRIDPRLSTNPLYKAVALVTKPMDLHASGRPHVMVANSCYTQSKIKEHYKRESIVIYPPVGVDDFRISDELGDYFLLAGRHVYYKKPDVVIEAFNRLGLPLKVMGSGPETEALKKMARPNIQFVGYVSDEEKSKLFSRCRALIFPGVEDFGITPVEVMASGRPVLAYGQGGAAETVVPGVTGELFLDQSAEAVVGAVRKFEGGKYDPAAIRSHALKFRKSLFVERFKKLSEVEYDVWQRSGSHASIGAESR